MSMNPSKSIRFSVITVMYNAGEYAEGTILSVIKQNYDNIQFVVVDGKSTDNTVNILNKYKERIDILVSEKDSGIYDAMNKGIHLADGDYLIFMNAGDRFASPYVLEEMSKHITVPSDVYYGNSIQVFTDRKYRRKEKTNRFRITRFNICHQALFYPSGLIKSESYDLSYRILADWALNIKLIGMSTFHYVKLDICEYDMAGVSSTDNRMKDPVFIRDLPMLIRNNLGVFPYLFYLTKEVIKRCLTWR